MCIWNAAYDGSQIRRLLNIKPELYRAIRIQTGTSTMVGAVKLVHWWWQNMPGWSFWVSWHLILPSAKDPAHILHCHLKPSLFFIKSSFPPMNHIICHLWLYYVHYAIYYVMYYFIDRDWRPHRLLNIYSDMHNTEMKNAHYWITEIGLLTSSTSPRKETLDISKE